MQTIASLPLTPGPDIVAQAHEWLETLAISQQWPARTMFGLALSMDEALSNIALYAFPARLYSHAEIQLTLQQDQDRLILEITDNGKPFDPIQHDSPDLAPSLDDALPGGHGLRLMRNYLDGLDYAYVDGRNQLRLTARLPASRSGRA